MVARIVVVDDHRIMREGLCTLLEREPDIEVVGSADNGREAIRLVDELKPDVVIMDVAMREMNGVEATRQILVNHPATRVLGLSMHSDSRFIREMLRAGAAGYMLKDCATEELAAAIHSVLEGRLYMSSDVNDSVVKDYVDQLSTSVSSVLTAREREVLQLVAEGGTTSEIADLLHVSVKTVESHRKQVMDKLSIRSVAGLTKYALREGLTALD
jgi:DNA-binding NarL/FixJ family response regulator